jgi:hypothetical protein
LVTGGAVVVGVVDVVGSVVVVVVVAVVVPEPDDAPTDPSSCWSP